VLLQHLIKQRNAKVAFLLNALPEFNTCLKISSIFDSRLILMLLYDFLSLVINAFSHRDCWGHGSGERKLRALQQLDCVADIQCTSELSSGFSISQGNAEALDR